MKKFEIIRKIRNELHISTGDPNDGLHRLTYSEAQSLLALVLRRLHSHSSKDT